MKNAFNGLCRLGTPGERVSELEKISAETPKTEMQKVKRNDKVTS